MSKFQIGDKVVTIYLPYRYGIVISVPPENERNVPIWLRNRVVISTEKGNFSCYARDLEKLGGN